MAVFTKCPWQVDLLKCPKCAGHMKIISFIECHLKTLIEMIHHEEEAFPRSPANNTEPLPFGARTKQM
jgi:hypothetical protein